MRFYSQQHKFYGGIDLHARKMYVCIIDLSLLMIAFEDESFAESGPRIENRSTLVIQFEMHIAHALKITH